MGTKSSRRSVAGGFSLVVFACAAALALAGQAGAATTAYPVGANGFDGGADGWVGSGATCTIPVLTCETTNVHDPAVGNPPGSIATVVDVPLAAVGLLTGGGTWTSPAFALPTDQVIDGATFGYDRRFDAGGLLPLLPTSTVEVTLTDETTGVNTPLLTDDLTAANTAFAQATAPAAVVAGHTYRISLATVTSATLGVGLLSDPAQTRFDNVALTIQTSAPGGNGGNGNSPGVTIVRGPYGDSEIASMINRFDIDADSGGGRDGSLIPIAMCTILGTSGSDRITGTSGNDVICGLGGDDVISGVGGRDAIDGADGNDRLSGGIGGDLLLGLRGNDRLDGGTDADRIGGGADNDRIEAGNGGDIASGGSGNDAVGGEAGHDKLRGLAGNDRVNGGPGRDRLDGGAGNDVLRGFSGKDTLVGGSGTDRLDGGSGRDRLLGGSGADRLALVDGVRDTANGGPGRDRAVADRVDRIRRVPVIARR
ncbi:MAG TPA: calcium-binding protein [Thermoleophilaceae bacterium]|nr:calcium-binding protein [Thermoleophilaceae bacterium]